MKNLKYSHGDFTGQDLKNEPPEDFVGDIVGSCFYQEKLTGDDNAYIKIFPLGMTGANFIRCNLTNVSIPNGNTYTDCVKYRSKQQNDLSQWVVDADGVPSTCVTASTHEKYGTSTDPNDIPLTKQQKPIGHN
jgi:hypothetical protein